MRCRNCGTKMTAVKEFTGKDDGKQRRDALWKCSKCGYFELKKLSWRQIKYRDNEEYRNYTKGKMKEIYAKKHCKDKTSK